MKQVLQGICAWRKERGQAGPSEAKPSHFLCPQFQKKKPSHLHSTTSPKCQAQLNLLGSFLQGKAQMTPDPTLAGSCVVTPDILREKFKACG